MLKSKVNNVKKRKISTYPWFAETYNANIYSGAWTGYAHFDIFVLFCKKSNNAPKIMNLI